MSIGHKKERLQHRGRRRLKRVKTFASLEKAKQWAESQKIKDYTVVNPRQGLSTKFKIIVSK